MTVSGLRALPLFARQKVRNTRDQEPVVAFAPHGLDPALGDRVRPRRADQRLDDPHAERDEHFIEDAGVLGVAV
jgi:hypothetical protein